MNLTYQLASRGNILEGTREAARTRPRAATRDGYRSCNWRRRTAELSLFPAACQQVRT